MLFSRDTEGEGNVLSACKGRHERGAPEVVAVATPWGFYENDRAFGANGEYANAPDHPNFLEFFTSMERFIQTIVGRAVFVFLGVGVGALTGALARHQIKLEDNMLLQLCNACKSCLLLEASAADRKGEGMSRVQPLQHGALSILQTVSRK